MSQNPLSTKLEITVKDQDVRADLRFRNLTESTLHIDKYKLALDGELSTRAFVIEDEDGNSLQYIGKLIKRKPGPDNFVELPADKAVSTSIELNKFYKFPEKTQKYKAHFFAFDPFDGLDDMYEVGSNVVEFTYP